MICIIMRLQHLNNLIPVKVIAILSEILSRVELSTVDLNFSGQMSFKISKTSSDT